MPVSLLLPLVPARGAAQTLGSLPGDTLKETGRIVTSPLHMSLGQAALLTGIVATDLGAYKMDGRIRDTAINDQSPSSKGFINFFEKFGNAGYDAAFLVAYGGAGKLFGNDYMTETAILAAESYLAANATGLILKYSIGRARPYAGLGNSDFSPFNMKGANASFPSGHTISAFSIASVFAARADSTWIKILAYAVASGVALQRVSSDNHWASDVIAGAAIGTLVGRDVVKMNSKKNESAIKIVPSAGGLALKMKF